MKSRSNQNNRHRPVFSPASQALIANASSPRTEALLNIESISPGNAYPEDGDVPHLPRPFPAPYKCDASDARQRWSVLTNCSGCSADFGLICDVRGRNLCFNVQQSEQNIILFGSSTPPGKNSLFGINATGHLWTPLKSQLCVLSQGFGEQPVLGNCAQAGETMIFWKHAHTHTCSHTYTHTHTRTHTHAYSPTHIHTHTYTHTLTHTHTHTHIHIRMHTHHTPLFTQRTTHGRTFRQASRSSSASVTAPRCVLASTVSRP